MFTGTLEFTGRYASRDVGGREARGRGVTIPPGKGGRSRMSGCRVTFRIFGEERLER